MFTKLYANSIKNRRIKYHISQQNLADALGISRQAISKIERGILIPSYETYKKIDAMLNITNPIDFKEKLNKLQRFLKKYTPIFLMLIFAIFSIFTIYYLI